MDSAKDSLRKALEIEPNNMQIRSEYKELCSAKSAKEREWDAKMSGFFDSAKMRKIEKVDEQEKTLMHKIRRKHYSRIGEPTE